MLPLQGIRVADFSHLLPGPLCARRLQGLGAEVWKIELPQWPDPARRLKPMFRWLHGGQRLVRLDYRKREGLEALLRMLARADVLVEGFRPGLMDRLGLGWRVLTQRFPRLVYCSISGYGRAGPRRSGHDLNFQGLAGCLGDPPRAPAVPVADVAGALGAAGRILAALFAREKSGRGACLDVSLAGEAREACAPGLSALLHASPFYGLYPARDGRWLAVAALEPRYGEEDRKSVV